MSETNTVNSIQGIQCLDNKLKDASKDFYEAARMSTKNIKNNLSQISEVNSRGKVMNTQELETLLKNLNKVAPQSQDEELQKVAREFSKLNTNFFQCLESHSKSIRRNLLQINTVVDQHNLTLMPYTVLNSKLKDKLSMDKLVSHRS